MTPDVIHQSLSDSVFSGSVTLGRGQSSDQKQKVLRQRFSWILCFLFQVVPWRIFITETHSVMKSIMNSIRVSSACLTASTGETMAERFLLSAEPFCAKRSLAAAMMAALTKYRVHFRHTISLAIIWCRIRVTLHTMQSLKALKNSEITWPDDSQYSAYKLSFWTSLLCTRARLSKLLGHSSQKMTECYKNDRGEEWSGGSWPWSGYFEIVLEAFWGKKAWNKKPTRFLHSCWLYVT